MDGSARDFAEVIRDADSRVDLGRYEVRIDLSRHYDFDTEFDESINVRYLLRSCNCGAQEPLTYPRKLTSVAIDLEQDVRTRYIALAALEVVGPLGLRDWRWRESGQRAGRARSA